MEAQYFIPPLSLHDFLGEMLPLCATTRRKPVVIEHDMAVFNLGETKEKRIYVGLTLQHELCV
jgi:hypothetical protein